MSARLAHRGPDDSSVFLARDSPIALAHRRLAVIAPSDAGRQPMRSSNGLFEEAATAEIYTIKQAKVGLFRDIDYSDYPLASKHSRGGKMER